MLIEFCCKHCGERITAPEPLVGKKGLCPFCRGKMLIPSRMVARLQLETNIPTEDVDLWQIESELLRSNNDRYNRLDAVSATNSTHEPQVTQNDVETQVCDFMVAMAAGELEVADRIANDLARRKQIRDATIDRIDLDRLDEPALKMLPRPLLQGFLKQLRRTG